MDPMHSPTLLEEYQAIYESCNKINNLLDNGSLKDVEYQLENCIKKFDDVINMQSFLPGTSHGSIFISALISMQQQLQHQKNHIQNVIKERVEAENKVSSNTNNFPVKNSPENNSNKSKQLLENCEVDTTGQGFEKIAGLQEIKSALISSVILPFKQPQLFKGLKLNCILLFGPPGTGKTKLAIATAAEAGAKLISITSSDILSPYVGESEKFIAGVFHHIRTNGTPTILFIDEIDALCRSRKEDEADYIRRLKTEFLCQLSNFDKIPNSYLICATNYPWQLDTAFKRRFQRHLFVPLPNAEERHEILDLFVRDTPLEKVENLFETVVPKTEGYSGSDIEQFVTQVLVKSVERLQYEEVWIKLDDDIYVPFARNDLSHDCWRDVRMCKIHDLPVNSVRLPQVLETDVLKALDESRPSVDSDEYKRYELYITKK